MEALILNREFQTQCIVDAFESFIWSDRYREPGDFEIYMPVEKAPLKYMIKNYYVWQKNSDRLMILEDIAIDTDAESGAHITITGRSLESILERRVVAYRTVLSGNMQDGIERVFNENIINPDDPERRIPQVRFIRSTDPRITSLTCEANLLGDSILSLVESVCELYDLGFKIMFNEEQSTFDFTFYYGEDRSYDQEKNPWVVFSPQYDNLLGSSYFESDRDLKTAGVVAGSDSDELGQEVVDVDRFPELTGLDRRETYIDGGDVERPQTEVNEESIRERLEKRNRTEEEILIAIDEAKAQAAAQDRTSFRQQLEQKGYEELSKTFVTRAFEGQIEAVRQYIYDRDFFIGDVVQVMDQYGMEASSRITEVTRTHDIDGESLAPTFTTLEKANA